jgi:general secretion pathway protein G
MDQMKKGSAMKREGRKSRRRGFTMIEAIVVIVIIGVIAAMIAPRLIGRIGQSKQAVAKSNAEALSMAMRNYIIDMGAPPESGGSLDVLWKKPSSDEGKWRGPYVDNEDALKDPWDHPYILVIPGQYNADFDIVSYGADGQPGGEADNADIISGKK